MVVRDVDFSTSIKNILVSSNDCYYSIYFDYAKNGLLEANW